ncbi:hypothetical protein [Streptomyces capitiformicae]|uniref:Uncharacterized protein n=1 Tax=Streptomyces capitiformicae TaxID=2014920 RepID=A0A919L349_9ACTN|nr:hypothetical protein [Streptomyces capitiformicae]GHH82198.1 hypothetical protein GCM10017771_05740 [Streptomyces capitiformicae]
MTTQKPKYHSPSEPLAEPSAKPGCSACMSLAVARQNARSDCDYSAVSDVNVELRRHHAEAHRA